MEPEDIKAAWKSLEQRLEREATLDLLALRDRRVDKARSSLRPLFWGQVVQIGFGLLFILLGGLLWSTEPTIASVIVAGIVVHAYGVVTIACAGVVLASLSRIDYAAPVVAIQKQLARVRRMFVISGLVVGMPWWFLWVPVLMVLAGLVGVDIAARAPGMVWGGLGVGVAGLLATWAFYRWSHAPQRAALGRKVDESAVAGSLRRAQAQLDDVVRFEQE